MKIKEAIEMLKRMDQNKEIQIIFNDDTEIDYNTEKDWRDRYGNLNDRPDMR